MRESYDDVDRREASLDTLVPANANKPYDMKELILKVADEADFDAPLGELVGQLRGHVGQQVEDPAGNRSRQNGGDAIRHLGHCLVTELADRRHVRAEALDHE